MSLTSPRSRRSSTFIASWLGHPRWPLLAGVVAIVLTLPALWTGFVVDDYVHRAMFLDRPGFETAPLEMFSFIGGDADRRDELRRLALPWWSADDLKLSFWRPVAALTHLLDYTAWPNSPWLMHLQSLLWYAALVVAAALLFRRFFAIPWQAGLAAFAYAVSHTHAIPAFFIANRNALIGAVSVVTALLLHHRWRTDGSRRAATLGPLAFLAGLLANEGAVAAFGYLLAYAWFIDRDAPRRRVLSLTPYLVLTIGWRLWYQAQGHGAWASEMYVDPVASPTSFLGAVAGRAPMYLLSEWLVPPVDFAGLVSAGTWLKWQIAATLFVLILVRLLLPLLRRDRSARFWFTGMMLSVIPACAAYPGDRMLLLSEIGGAALLVQWLAAVYAGVLWPGAARVRRLVARVFFDLFVAVHLVLSPIWLPIGVLTTTDAFRGLTDGVEKLARDPQLSRKLVVMVDDVMFTGGYFSALRALAGLEPVEQLLVLAPIDTREGSIVLSRPSANALVMQVSGGYRWLLERDRAHPFAVGDRVVVNAVRVDIQAVDAGGRPTKVAFLFDRPLEDDSIAWFGRLESPAPTAFPLRGFYPPWKPPAIGRTVAAR